MDMQPVYIHHLFSLHPTFLYMTSPKKPFDCLPLVPPVITYDSGEQVWLPGFYPRPGNRVTFSSITPLHSMPNHVFEIMDDGSLRYMEDYIEDTPIPIFVYYIDACSPAFVLLPTIFHFYFSSEVLFGVIIDIVKNFGGMMPIFNISSPILSDNKFLESLSDTYRQILLNVKQRFDALTVRFPYLRKGFDDIVNISLSLYSNNHAFMLYSLYDYGYMLFLVPRDQLVNTLKQNKRFVVHDISSLPANYFSDIVFAHLCAMLISYWLKTSSFKLVEIVSGFTARFIGSWSNASDTKDRRRLLRKLRNKLESKITIGAGFSCGSDSLNVLQSTIDTVNTCIYALDQDPIIFILPAAFTPLRYYLKMVRYYVERASIVRYRLSSFIEAIDCNTGNAIGFCRLMLSFMSSTDLISNQFTCMKEYLTAGNFHNIERYGSSLFVPAFPYPHVVDRLNIDYASLISYVTDMAQHGEIDMDVVRFYIQYLQLLQQDVTKADSSVDLLTSLANSVLVSEEVMTR